jgi:hypothetical protein
MKQVKSSLIESEERSECLIKHRPLPSYHYGYGIIKRTHVLIHAHNGYPRTFTMGLSRILKSFSTISFAWFYLFIMLDNAEAKIGRRNNNNTNNIHTYFYPSTDVSVPIKLSCVFDYHNYVYLQYMAATLEITAQSMTKVKF